MRAAGSGAVRVSKEAAKGLGADKEWVMASLELDIPRKIKKRGQ